MKKTKHTLEDQLFGGSLKRTRKTKSKTPKMKWISLSDGTSVIRREKSKPISETQAKQRMRWTMSTRFAITIKEALNFSSCYLKNMTSINYAVKNIFSDCFTGDYPDYKLNYSNILISKGRVKPLLYPRLKISARGRGKLDWLIEKGESGAYGVLQPGDELCVLLYNESKDTTFFLPDIKMPKVPEIVFKQPYANKKDKLHCWVYGIHRYPTVSSDSLYVEIVYED